jgi:two-component system NtrC family sensor kinase
LHDLIERARQQPAFDRIQIVERVAPDLPRIEADPGQLPNIFVNLMDNAADAMPDGGTLTIQADPSPDRQSVVVHVKDTGYGIPPENIKKLFSPFFTTKPVGQGTGLGLSIAYGVVKMHLGTIQVNSDVGKGTTFTITLPVRLPKNGMQAISPEEIALLEDANG